MPRPTCSESGGTAAGRSPGCRRAPRSATGGAAPPAARSAHRYVCARWTAPPARCAAPDLHIGRSGRPLAGHRQLGRQAALVLELDRWPRAAPARCPPSWLRVRKCTSSSRNIGIASAHRRPARQGSGRARRRGSWRWRRATAAPVSSGRPVTGDGVAARVRSAHALEATAAFMFQALARRWPPWPWLMLGHGAQQVAQAIGRRARCGTAASPRPAGAGAGAQAR